MAADDGIGRTSIREVAERAGCSLSTVSRVINRSGSASAPTIARVEAAVADVGLRKVRVWRLYLAASRFGFERNLIQLHQVLATRTAPDGSMSMPLRPDWGS